MKSKKLTTLLVIMVMILACIYTSNKPRNDAYNRAINFIGEGAYKKALVELEKANPDILDRDEFRFDSKYGKMEKGYRNSLQLYAYAMAMDEYNSKNPQMDHVGDYLEFIPADYSGKLSEEIKNFKEDFKPKYSEYLAEQKIKEAEIIKKQSEEFEKWIKEETARIKSSVPYVGMSESWINDTVLGKSFEKLREYRKNNGKTTIVDVYRFRKNGSVIFIANCIDGEVVAVGDYRDNPIYVGIPKPYKKKTYADDPYDVNDYSNEEDFYDDHYDDFFDYEDAADYYNEHHE